MESNSKNKSNIDKDNSTDNNNNISRNMKGKTLSLQESDLSEFIRENNKLSSPVNNKNIILLLFYI